MAEPEYSPAFAVDLGGGWLTCIYPTSQAAESVKAEIASWYRIIRVVELIPRPVHERLVAAERAAERERLMAIAKLVRQQGLRHDPQDSTDYERGWWEAANQIMHELGDVPASSKTSGEEYSAKTELEFKVFVDGDPNCYRPYWPAACGPGYVRLTHALWFAPAEGSSCELTITVDGKKAVLKGFTEKSPVGGSVIYWRQVEEECVASK